MRAIRFLSMLVLGLAAGCSDAPDPEPPPSAGGSPAQPEPTVPKAKGPPKPVEPASVGSIRGSVRFEGTPPERKPLAVDGAGGCKTHGEKVLPEDVVVEGGGLVNVFVHVKAGHDAWIAPAPPAPTVTMDQRGCVYRPHVLGMRVGQKLLVRNGDPTTHNVNIRSDRNDRLNPTQPPEGAPVEWKPTKREVGAAFECNLHNWMKAWVCVVDHPWFAVSGAGGTFAIEGVPPGEYVVEAWHEKYGRKSLKVAVAAGAASEAGFTFRAP